MLTAANPDPTFDREPGFVVNPDCDMAGKAMQDPPRQSGSIRGIRVPSIRSAQSTQPANTAYRLLLFKFQRPPIRLLQAKPPKPAPGPDDEARQDESFGE